MLQLIFLILLCIITYIYLYIKLISFIWFRNSLIALQRIFFNKKLLCGFKWWPVKLQLCNSIQHSSSILSNSLNFLYQSISIQFSLSKSAVRRSTWSLFTNTLRPKKNLINLFKYITRIQQKLPLKYQKTNSISRNENHAWKQ